MLGAGFLAFIVVLPAPSQAHLTGLQLEVSRLCNTKLSERVSRTEGTCKGQTLAKVVLPEPLPISGKVAAALAGDLYCGLSSTGVSELTRAADIPLLPHATQKRAGQAAANGVVEWPSWGFDPSPDTRMNGAFSWRRLPDG